MADADVKLKEALRDKATKELESWYEQRQVAIDKRKAANRIDNTTEVNEPKGTSGSEATKYDLNIPHDLSLPLANGSVLLI